MKLNCLIIDDEPMARKGLEEHLREIDFLTLVAKCESAGKASTYLDQGIVDLILLDINMPRLSGIDFLKSLKKPPMVIFTTAYSEFALEGYALDVIDYLVKPIPFERFQKAVQKAHDFHALRHKTEGHSGTKKDYFFIKCDGKFEKIFFKEILYAEALQNYVVLYTSARKYMAYLTFRSIESQLPADRFLKVHKSYIVSLEQVISVEGSEVMVHNTRIPVSRNLKDEVVKRILGNDLLKR